MERGGGACTFTFTFEGGAAVRELTRQGLDWTRVFRCQSLSAGRWGD